jgi:hypothetical protein
VLAGAGHGGAVTTDRFTREADEPETTAPRGGP